MKRASVYILVAVMCLSLFAGCSRRNNDRTETPTPDPVVTASPDTIVPNTDGAPDGSDNGMNEVLDDAADGVQNAVDDAENAVEDMMPDAEDGKITDGDDTENGTNADSARHRTTTR